MAALLLAAAAWVGGAGGAAAGGDPLSYRQWSLAQIGAPQAWPRTTGAGVLVGIVDTGVDLEHEDLAGQIETSADCVGADGDPAACGGRGDDDDGHGTQVAGIVAATTGNDRGIAGIAPDARLVVARALVSDGRGRAAGSAGDVEAGIRWVVDRGARVVNLSLGISWRELGAGASSRLSQGIAYAWSRGAVPVLASGNDRGAATLPQPYFADLDALVVGATGRSGALTGYSAPTGEAKWAMVAPGGEAGPGGGIVSTSWEPGGANWYGEGSGTSMAAAHVSGTVALLLAQGLGPEEAVQRVLDTADPSRPCGDNCRGRLDTARATAFERPVTTTPAPPPAEGGAQPDAAAAEAGGAGTGEASPVPAPTPVEPSVPPAPLPAAPAPALVPVAPVPPPAVAPPGPGAALDAGPAPTLPSESYYSQAPPAAPLPGTAAPAANGSPALWLAVAAVPVAGLALVLARWRRRRPAGGQAAGEDLVVVHQPSGKRATAPVP